ncbi:MAG TPA: gluconate:H+ symporter [Saprospiraceae bacterium]|nr:gluconate:H+ symporter [Saprospiraceae bacterium]HMQ83413.1 gluconate:H+ symporter [Saprospiraceae bacterium]
MSFLIILLAVILQVFLTVKKVNPFLSLLLVAILAGLCFGMPPMKVVESIERGVSSTLGGLVLVIILGAALGKVLEVSGAAERIANSLISSFGVRYIQWAVLLTGFMIGIPLFYNAGFIILIPLVFMLARKTGMPILYIAIPMAASLSVTHCFLPPHPGPVFLINELEADTGQVLMYGILMAIPAVVIAGPLFGKMLNRLKVDAPLGDSFQAPEVAARHQMPALFPSFFIALLPVLLITLSVVVKTFLPTDSWLKTFFIFTGDSTIALLISFLAAIYVFGIRQGYSIDTTMKWLTESVSDIAMIVLIITAGGVFKQVLVDSGTGAEIAALSSQWQMPPLLFAWLVTALLRVMIGSATVSGITAAGIVAPLVQSGAASAELMVLAVGAGSVFFSHVNDSGFWMFKEFFHLSIKQTFLSWSIMETIISIIGLIFVLLLNTIL